ncbi:MAG: hypothetical protein NVSMB5_19600 [Candidatus Velthaea sp.]
MNARGLSLAVLVALGGCAEAAQQTQSPGDRFVELYKKLHPSVVLFTMNIPSDDPKRKGRYDLAYGSGVVVESGAWGSRVLTDAHVVQDATNLRVRIGDGTTAAAHVIATSNDTDDVAIVETLIPNIPAVKLGTSKTLEPGSPIGMLGYPIPDAFSDEHLGTMASLYTGHVASVRKGALEIDVPVIPGESGGPVFDAATGDIIGIAESRFDEERSIGFATPIDTAVSFLKSHPRR